MYVDHTVKMAPHDSFQQESPGKGTGRVEERREIGRTLFEVNTRAVCREQNELKEKFKIAVHDMINIEGQVMKYTYIPTGIKRQLVWFGVNCNQKWWDLVWTVTRSCEIWCGL